VTDIVNTAADMNIVGGTVKIDDSRSSNTQSFCSLTLSGNSTLDFGSGNTNVLHFVSLGNFSGTLSVKGWTGTPYDFPDTMDNGLASQDRLLFLGDPGFASNTAINNILFYDDAGAFLGNGMEVQYGGQFEIVPVPEPATTALIGSVALCALIGLRERRRVRKACNRLVGKRC